MPSSSTTQLRHAKNIGPTIEKRLNEVGIFTFKDLKIVTPAKAYQLICQKYPDKTIPVCYYLYALQGALINCHWDDLSIQQKAQLKKDAGI